MTKDDKEIVSAILSRIAGRVGQQRLEMWLGVAAEIRLEDRKLHILLPDGFKLERLRRGRKDILAVAGRAQNRGHPAHATRAARYPADRG